MSNNYFVQNYSNSKYINNQISQIDQNYSPYKEDRNIQYNGYMNKEPLQKGYNLFNNFSYYSTPKKGVNLNEPDTLFSPIVSGTKVDLSINQLLSNRKNHYLNDTASPFKKMVNNTKSPYIFKR